MHRLAISKVVDAATAVNATNADKLGGKDTTALMSIAGSAVNPSIDVIGGAEPVIVTSLTGFDVPTGGGVITATVSSKMSVDGLQLGFVWPVVDGTCADDLPDGGVGFYFSDGVAVPVGEVSGSIAAQVAPGTHRIDVCTAALGGVATQLGFIRLNVVWSPVASGAGVASSSGTTLEELMARYSGLLDN